MVEANEAQCGMQTTTVGGWPRHCAVVGARRQLPSTWDARRRQRRAAIASGKSNKK